jgi:hypothetical protein
MANHSQPLEDCKDHGMKYLILYISSVRCGFWTLLIQRVKAWTSYSVLAVCSEFYLPCTYRPAKMDCAGLHLSVNLSNIALCKSLSPVESALLEIQIRGWQLVTAFGALHNHLQLAIRNMETCKLFVGMSWIWSTSASPNV